MKKRLSLLVLSFILLACAGRSHSGMSFVGNAVGAEPFTAEVWLGGVTASKTAIYPDNDFVDFTQTVVATTDVPNTATIKVEFSDYNNPGHVPYSVSARAQTKTLSGGGKSTSYTFRLTTNGNDANTGTITMQFKLDTVTGATAIDPLTKDVEIIVQARGVGPR